MARARQSRLQPLLVGDLHAAHARRADDQSPPLATRREGGGGAEGLCGAGAGRRCDEPRKAAERGSLADRARCSTAAQLQSHGTLSHSSAEVRRRREGAGARRAAPCVRFSPLFARVTHAIFRVEHTAQPSRGVSRDGAWACLPARGLGLQGGRGGRSGAAAAATRSVTPCAGAGGGAVLRWPPLTRRRHTQAPKKAAPLPAAVKKPSEKAAKATNPLLDEKKPKAFGALAAEGAGEAAAASRSLTPWACRHRPGAAAAHAAEPLREVAEVCPHPAPARGAVQAAEGARLIPSPRRARRPPSPASPPDPAPPPRRCRPQSTSSPRCWTRTWVRLRRQPSSSWRLDPEPSPQPHSCSSCCSSTARRRRRRRRSGC